MALPLILTACAASQGETSRPGHRWLTSAEASIEYQRAAATLRLPPGASWPKRLYPSTGEDGEPQFYQPGIGSVDASSDWFCVWLGEAIDHPDSPASTALADVRRTSFYTDALRGRDRAYLEKVVTAVERGEMALGADFYSKNCS